MICGSMHFAKEMLDAKETLEKKGHEILLPTDIHECFINPNLKGEFDSDHEKELRHCIERNLLMDGLQKISECDAIVHLNYDKNEIPGYIGTAGLMELGVAFFLKKKIYLLYPYDKTQKYAVEVELTQPIVLDGDLNKITAQ